MSVSTTDEEINFTNKDHLIEEFSVRYWYSLPAWPPVDYDYTDKLRAQNLRRVEIKNWKLEPEEVNGLHKVFELESYPGEFKDSQNRTYNMRPMETCPSLNNFQRMDRLRL
jgi:hypothetical protein